MSSALHGCVHPLHYVRFGIGRFTPDEEADNAIAKVIEQVSHGVPGVTGVGKIRSAHGFFETMGCPCCHERKLAANIMCLIISAVGSSPHSSNIASSITLALSLIRLVLSSVSGNSSDIERSLTTLSSSREFAMSLLSGSVRGTSGPLGLNAGSHRL